MVNKFIGFSIYSGVIMQTVQKGILATENKLARYMTFSLVNIAAAKESLAALQEFVDGESVVVGVGESLTKALDVEINGLKPMPVYTSSGIDIPSTPCALWLWLRVNDRGELFHLSRKLELVLSTSFELTDVIDSFKYSESRDLSGYVDGTENPQDDQAIKAAIVSGEGEGMDGSSFVAVQQWLHDFDVLNAMNDKEKDDTIGRHVSDNEEFDEAPDNAHVKRAAQESFTPEAFILRRSMPWAEGMEAGLVFVAFGKSFVAFDAILKRMIGLEDGLRDALFDFTKPITGAYLWCPPMKGKKLDLTKLGL